jgi:hypothetical protein
VTPNLASALKAFRRDESSGKHPRTLWVDAVCINQNDIQEKNQQVAQMQEIYAGAKEVLVWLGPSNPHLDTGILFMQKPATSAEEHRIPYEGVRDIYNLPISDLQPLISRYPVERFGRDWEHAFELLRLPWWGRTWIVQEVASAKYATFTLWHQISTVACSIYVYPASSRIPISSVQG